MSSNIVRKKIFKKSQIFTKNTKFWRFWQNPYKQKCFNSVRNHDIRLLTSNSGTQNHWDQSKWYHYISWTNINQLPVTFSEGIRSLERWQNSPNCLQKLQVTNFQCPNDSFFQLLSVSQQCKSSFRLKFARMWTSLLVRTL